ncbi:AIM24 family protein, partial [bacterium]
MTPFSLKNPRLLQVDLSGQSILARAGSMVAYDGQIKFDKAIIGNEGVFGALKRKATGEGMALMTTSGKGTVYFAQNGAEILIIPLQNEKIWVESSVLLAFDKDLKTNTVFAGLRGASSGQGLSTTTVEGIGNIAIISHGTALELEVSPSYP